MKLASFPVNVIFISVVVLTFKYTEPQVPNAQQCNPMRFSNSLLNLQQFAGTWYEFGRYYSNVKKNLICSSVSIVIQNDGFIFIHSALDVKREKATVLAIEGGKLMMTTEDYTPPILKVRYSKTKTTISYQVLDTDYISYAILWSCENKNKPAGVGSKVFAWVLTRDLHISPEKQKWLMERLDEIGIKPDLILKTYTEDCDVINAYEMCAILKMVPLQANDDSIESTLNTMTNESTRESIENPMNSESTDPTSSELNINPMTSKSAEIPIPTKPLSTTDAICPIGFNCYPIETTTTETETPSTEPTTELPITTTEMTCPKGYNCYPISNPEIGKSSSELPMLTTDTNTEQPADDIPITETELNCSKGEKCYAMQDTPPEESSTESPISTTQGICPEGYICNPKETTKAVNPLDEMSTSATETVVCSKGEKCYSPESQNMGKLSIDLNITKEINCPNGYTCTAMETKATEGPSTEKSNPTTVLCPSGFSCSKLPTSVIEDSIKCTEPNCVPMATCYASTTYGGSFGSSTSSECNCPTINNREEIKTEICQQSSPPACTPTTTDGFTVGKCDNAKTATYDYSVVTTTTPVDGQYTVIGQESTNVTDRDVTAAQSIDGELPDIVRSPGSSTNRTSDSESTFKDPSNNTNSTGSETPVLTKNSSKTKVNLNRTRTKEGGKKENTTVITTLAP